MGHRLDAEFAAQLVQQRALMQRDGMDREDMAAVLERQREFHKNDRAQHLDELHAWLLSCEKRLH